MQPRHKYLTGAITIITTSILLMVAITQGKKSLQRTNPAEAYNTPTPTNPTPSFRIPNCELELIQGCMTREELARYSVELEENQQIQAGKIIVSRYNANYLEVVDFEEEVSQYRIVFQGEVDSNFLLTLIIKEGEYEGSILTLFGYTDPVSGKETTMYHLTQPVDPLPSFPEGTF